MDETTDRSVGSRFVPLGGGFPARSRTRHPFCPSQPRKALTEAWSWLISSQSSKNQIEVSLGSLPN